FSKMRSRIRVKMMKARKIKVERTSNRMVSSELLGRIKPRFSEAWLYPRNARTGTRINRTMRKILRLRAGSGFMGFSIQPSAFSLQLQIRQQETTEMCPRRGRALADR